jgi:hypothetical protein
VTAPTKLREFFRTTADLGPTVPAALACTSRIMVLVVDESHPQEDIDEAAAWLLGSAVGDAAAASLLRPGVPAVSAAASPPARGTTGRPGERRPMNLTWIQRVPTAAVHAAYVVWPPGRCAAPDVGDRTGFVGCVWQTVEGGPWFAVVGESPMTGLGSFPTLHDAHLAIDEAAQP